MSKPKGSPKTGGREKGTKNKTSEELKAKILWFENVGFDMIEKYMKNPKIKKEEKIKLWADVGPKVLKHVLAVQTETKLNIDDDTIKAINEAKEKVNAAFSFKSKPE